MIIIVVVLAVIFTEVAFLAISEAVGHLSYDYRMAQIKRECDILIGRLNSTRRV